MTPKKHEITHELDELGLQALSSHGNETAFQVPDRYFESFSSKVMESITTEEKKLAPGKANIIRFQTAISMAASFLLLVALGISFLMLRNGKEDGFLAEKEEFYYDEYFARVTEMDRTLLYDLLLTPEEMEPNEALQATETEDDYLLDYLLDAAPYSGIEPIEIILQYTDNQP